MGVGQVERLREELDGIDVLIEYAALRKDAEEFTRLQMRKSALPVLIREERARPVREETGRLEAELSELGEELAQAQESEPPPVPAGRAGHMTPQMAKSALISGITDRSTSVSRELKARRRELSELEAGGAGAP